MRRLLEDPEQPEVLREELMRSRDAARDYAVEDKLLQLQAALAHGARQVSGAETARGWHPAWKLASVIALGGGVALLLARPAAVPAPPQPRSQELQVAQPLVPAQAEPAAAPQPTAAEPAAPPAVEPKPEAPPAAEPKAATPEPPAKSSRREIAQLLRIRSLLERDPAAAQRLAERSEREFPDGLLSEERRALSIIALAKTGARASAARKAREFFARYPQSPMRGSIEAELNRESR